MMLGSSMVLVSSATAAPFTELEASWTGAAGTATTVPNGSIVEGVARVNLNDDLGEQGVEHNKMVDFTFTHAVVEAIPEACKTGEYDPVSTISTDGHTLHCNVGTVEYGTAAVIEFAVIAAGSNGDVLDGTASTDGADPVDLGPKTITAVGDIDVVYDYTNAPGGNVEVGGSGVGEISTPLGLSLPVGAEPLAGPIAFDITAADVSSTNIAAVLQLADTDCHPNTSTSSTIPKTGPSAPVPPTCSITPAGPGKWRVVVDSYDSQPAAPVRKAANGDTLRADRVTFASMSFNFRTTAALNPGLSSFRMIASDITATTVGGTPVTEGDTTNNAHTYTFIPPGGIAATWNRGAVFGTNAIRGEGSQWAANAYAVAGERLEALVNSKIYANRRPADVAAGYQWMTCLVLDGDVSFTGKVAYNLTDNILDSAHTFQIFTGSVGAPGTHNAFDCNNAAGFTTVPSRDAGLSQDGNWNLRDLDVANPQAITAIRMLADPHQLKPGKIATGGGSLLVAEALVDADLTASGQMWMHGAGNHFNAPGVYNAANLGGTVVPTPGRLYASTTPMQDLVLPLPFRPRVEKTVDRPLISYGDTVTYTLRTSANINAGVTGNASWTITDELPDGLTFGTGSPAPTSVTANPGGSTTLRWNLTAPYNEVQEITYTATSGFHSGQRTNVATAGIPGTSDYNPSRTNGGIDEAQVRAAIDGQTYLTKETLVDVFPAGATNTWRLGLQNRDVVDQAQTDIIDILPWIGDGRGSAFHGDYAVTGVSTNPGESVYYATAEPSSLSTDPSAAANGALGAPSSLWSTTPPADRHDITAVRIVGGVLPIGATKYNDITWNARQARVGDGYENIAWAKATHTRLQMIKAAATTTIADGSQLQIDKQYRSHTGWEPGDTFSYDVTVKNPSSSTAYDVRSADLGGNGLDGTTAVYSGMSQGYFTGGFWEIGDLAAGQEVTATVTITVTSDPAARDWNRPFLNKIYVENPSHPIDPSALGPCQVTQDVDQDTDQCDDEAIATPRVRIAKLASEPNRNRVIEWTISVRNDGPFTIRDTVVVDEYPTALDKSTVRLVGDPSSNPSQGTFDAATGRWEIGTLTKDQVVTMTFAGQVSKEGLNAGIKNVAIVSTPDVPQPPLSGPDGTCGANLGKPNIGLALDADDDQCDVTYTGATQLKVNKETRKVTVKKTKSGKPAKTGTVVWDIAAGNYGGHDARNTIVVDTLPRGVVPGSLTVTKAPTMGSIDTATGVWTIGTLKPGQVVTAQVSARFPVKKLVKTVVNRVIIDSPDSPYCSPLASPTSSPAGSPAGSSAVTPTPETMAGAAADSCLPPCITVAQPAGSSSTASTGSCLPPCSVTEQSGAITPGMVTGTSTPSSTSGAAGCVPPCQVLTGNQPGSVTGEINGTAPLGTTSGLCVPPCTGEMTAASKGGACLPPCVATGKAKGGKRGSDGVTGCYPPCQNNPTLESDVDQCDIAPARYKLPREVPGTPNTGGGDWLPNAGGPLLWLVIVAGLQLIVGAALVLRARRPAAGSAGETPEDLEDAEEDAPSSP